MGEQIDQGEGPPGVNVSRWDSLIKRVTRNRFNRNDYFSRLAYLVAEKVLLLGVKTDFTPPWFPNEDPLLGVKTDFTPPWFPNEDPSGENWSSFRRLRIKVHQQSKDELTERILRNPKPDPEEFSAGAYVEDIEPQCRDAIFALRRKGWQTRSSGFYEGNIQAVDGDFSGIRQPTIQILESVGIKFAYYDLKIKATAVLYFLPERADLDEITQKWNQLAAIMPDKGKSASQVSSLGAKLFRQNPTDLSYRFFAEE